MTGAALSRAADLAFIDSSGRRATRPSDLVDGPTPRIDDRALAASLFWFPPEPPTDTPLDGVHADLPLFAWPEARPAIAADDIELCAALWAELRAAVDRCTSGFRRVALALGGIDSSGLLAALCELRPASEIIAISLDYGGADPDQPYVRAMTEAYGVRLIELSVDDALEYVETTLVVGGIPYWLLGGALDQLLFGRAANEGADLVVTGFAGDDIVGGDLASLPVEALDVLVGAELPLPESPWARTSRHLIAPRVRAVLPRALRLRRLRSRLASLVPWSTPKLRVHLEGSLDRYLRAYETPRSPMETARRRHEGFLRAMIARAQMVALQGLARADPYLDEGLGVLAATIPPRRLYAGNAHRGLFRRALPSRVPDAVRRRITKADPRVQTARLATAARPRLRRLASVDRLVARGWVDERVFAAAFASRDASDLRIWSTLATEEFLRRWNG